LNRVTARNAARRTYLALRRSASRALIERRAGVETADVVNLEDLGIDATDRVRYEPSGWLDLRRVLRRGDVGPSDVFVDFGAGKGRVLLQAARFPFARVIGVELSPELSDIARANVDAPQDDRRCDDVSVVTADVLDYAIPDDMTVAYLYNPFRGDVFDAFVEQLIASVDRAPRTVRVIYKTPMEADRLEATGRFRLVHTARGLRPGKAWSQKMAIRVYELAPGYAG
jgi:SAM-dependent methyltransferase